MPKNKEPKTDFPEREYRKFVKELKKDQRHNRWKCVIETAASHTVMEIDFDEIVTLKEVDLSAFKRPNPLKIIMVDGRRRIEKCEVELPAKAQITHQTQEIE